MSARFRSGDRVMIEIRTSEIFEGTVEYISSKSLELYNIFCQTTNTEYDGSMTFYCNEIVKIVLISDTAVTEVNSVPSASAEKILMDPDEFHRLQQMTFNYIFVDSFGKIFDDAVEVLSNRESIGVVGLGSTFTRKKPLSLLLMSDFKQVYIFDLYCLVHLKGLKDILESNFIVKVAHDVSVLYDCLYHRHKVDMQNIFDIKIVDKILSKENTNEEFSRNINECLTHHFNFPPSLLSAAVDDMVDKVWFDRPISKSNKVRAAQLVTYLLPLKDKLMANILKPYNEAITEHCAKFRNISDSDLLKFKIK